MGETVSGAYIRPCVPHLRLGLKEQLSLEADLLLVRHSPIQEARQIVQLQSGCSYNVSAGNYHLPLTHSQKSATGIQQTKTGFVTTPLPVPGDVVSLHENSSPAIC